MTKVKWGRGRGLAAAGALVVVAGLAGCAAPERVRRGRSLPVSAPASEGRLPVEVIRLEPVEAQDVARRRLLALLPLLDDLQLSFIDPETLSVYRAEGPFVATGWDGDALELRGAQAFGTGISHLRLEVRGATLWAIATVRGRAFVVRLH